MNEKIKNVSIFMISILFFICLLFVVNFIPQKSIKNNIQESILNIEKYEEYNLSKIPQVKTNNLEELYILETLYYHNSNNNIKSTLIANYNQIRETDTDYINTVKNMMNINSGLDSYGQYWNGMNIILRPLFTLFNLTQVKIILEIVLILLTGIYIYMCEKNNLRQLWISYLIGAVITNVFLTVISLEYIWTFLIMIIGANLILFTKKETSNLFIIFGVATAFFTHYTNALIIFIVMLLTYFEKYKTNDDFKQCIVSIFRLFIKWIISFILTIGTKWILTILICDIKLDLFSNYKFDLSMFQIIFNSLYLNISHLLPLNPNNSSTANMVILFVIIFVYMCFLYIYKTKNINHKKITLYICCIIANN